MDHGGTSRLNRNIFGVVIALATAVSSCTLRGGASNLDASFHPGVPPACTTTSGYPTAVLSDSPVAYWRLDEMAGTAATDSSGLGLTGTYTNGYLLNFPGALSVGNDLAVLFNGTNGYLSAPLVTVQTVNVTLEAWFKTSDYTQQRQIVVFNGSDLNGTGYGFSVNMEAENTGQMRILYSAITWFATGVFITDSNWHHGVLTIAADGHPEFWLDGLKVFTGGIAARNVPSLYTQIGKNDYVAAGSAYFYGAIDEVSIFNTALLPSSIQKHYTARNSSQVSCSP